MKHIQFLLICTVLSFDFMAASAAPHTVLAIVEAKEGKEDALKAALLSVVEPSRAEATNIEYKLHQDQNNPRQFFLYENWTSKEDHALQFEKPYIKAFIEKTSDMLAKPYQVIFGNQL